ncbi:MAG TPA: RidA family protein [Mycobacteriales bacterium]|jgi:enamine deaminase RidA (YjgF/YER057c/UK114 family)|nr:RidA family protein [Mycobacteriales bacterium]
MSSVSLIRSSSLSDVDYAYAAVVDPGARLIFTAGACPLDESGAAVTPGNARAQAAQVMDNLEAALAASGATLADVVKTTVYVASGDQADLRAAWLARHVDPGPGRATRQ